MWGEFTGLCLFLLVVLVAYAIMEIVKINKNTKALRQAAKRRHPAGSKL